MVERIVREHGGDDLLMHVGRQHRVEVDVGGVLAGHHDGVQAHGPVAVVFDGDLGLAVRTQIGHHALFAHGSEPLGKAMGQVDRQRHERRGVIARITEHEALIAGALQIELVDGLFQTPLHRDVHTLGDVGRLLPDRDLHAARTPVEGLVRRVIADLEDFFADEVRDLRVRLGGHLTGHHHQTGGHQGLDGDPRLGILAQHLVEDRVADRVGDLVRMTLGHGFGGEQACAHGFPSSLAQRC